MLELPTKDTYRKDCQTPAAKLPFSGVIPVLLIGLDREYSLSGVPMVHVGGLFHELTANQEYPVETDRDTYYAKGQRIEGYIWRLMPDAMFARLVEEHASDAAKAQLASRGVHCDAQLVHWFHQSQTLRDYLRRDLIYGRDTVAYLHVGPNAKLRGHRDEDRAYGDTYANVIDVTTRYVYNNLRADGRDQVSTRVTDDPGA